jgi:hypothetical protein
MADEINTDIQLKEIQLEAARLDFGGEATRSGEAPEQPRERHRIVVAAAIAALVTISTGMNSSTISSHQQALETQKASMQALLETQKAAAEAKSQQLKTESDMILEVVRTIDPDQAATNLQFLVDVGLIPITAPSLCSI